jgi:hypothetical protein
VALLLGPVELVDGEQVASGTAFELLPGCHVVEIGGPAGQAGEHGGWAASVPSVVYAMHMRPGATYVISSELDSTFRSGPNERASILAREHDTQGNVRDIPIAKDAEVIEACRGAAAF